MEKRKGLLVGLDLDRQAPQICTYEKESGDVAIAPMKIGRDENVFREILDRMEAQGRQNVEDDRFEKENRELEIRVTEIFRRAFTSLGIDHPDKQIDGIMTTVGELSKPLVHLLRGVYRRLRLAPGSGWIQDHRESFFYHTLYQDPELWNRNVGLFHFRGHEVTFYALEMNRRTRPVTAKVREGDTIYLEESPVRDEIFYQMILNSLRQDMYTSIFLLGEEFDKSWAGRSTALLCKGGRKVFVVDNLYARGACYAAREKTIEKRFSDYLYMGPDLVKKNTGMHMEVDGEERFFQLIQAGVNWYEAESVQEIILDEARELTLETVDMENGERTKVVIDLPDLPDRPPRTTRLKLGLTYESPSKCRIKVEDLGFGELFPSTGQVWQQVMEG